MVQGSGPRGRESEGAAAKGTVLLAKRIWWPMTTTSQGGPWELCLPSRGVTYTDTLSVHRAATPLSLNDHGSSAVSPVGPGASPAPAECHQWDL